MGIEVRPAEDDEIEKWNTYVNRSEQGTIFHRYEWLKTVERHSSALLHTYIGVKGETVIGLFPFYMMKKGPFKVIFSPLPGMGIPFLGPIILLDPNIKQRKKEKSNKRFIDSFLKVIEDDISPSHISITMGPKYLDTRPFSWNDFSLSTLYTYLIDLSGTEEDVIQRFSKDARDSIQNSEEEKYEIKEGDKRTIDFIWRKINRRYEEQLRSYPLDKNYLKDLYDCLPKDMISTYEGSVNGKRVSGRISLFSSKSCYLWQGSPKPEEDINVPINDLLNWRTIKDAISREIPFCDHVGANTYRLCQYKSKFNPELVRYHKVTKSGLSARIALKFYKKMKGF